MVYRRYGFPGPLGGPWRPWNLTWPTPLLEAPIGLVGHPERFLGFSGLSVSKHGGAVPAVAIQIVYIDTVYTRPVHNWILHIYIVYAQIVYI